jgi:hypothetical protein
VLVVPILLKNSLQSPCPLANLLEVEKSALNSNQRAHDPIPSRLDVVRGTATRDSVLAPGHGEKTMERSHPDSVKVFERGVCGRYEPYRDQSSSMILLCLWILLLRTLYSRPHHDASCHVQCDSLNCEHSSKRTLVGLPDLSCSAAGVQLSATP